MPFDTIQLQRIAVLARLALPQQQTDALVADLGRVLGLFDQLAAAPVDSIEPMAHPLDISLRTREDRVSEGDQAETLLALAPDARSGLYLVPKVIE